MGGRRGTSLGVLQPGEGGQALATWHFFFFLRETFRQWHLRRKAYLIAGSSLGLINLAARQKGREVLSEEVCVPRGTVEIWHLAQNNAYNSCCHYQCSLWFAMYNLRRINISIFLDLIEENVSVACVLPRWKGRFSFLLDGAVGP